MSRLLALDYKWQVAMIFVIALFMDILDATIVNVALPTFADEFDTDTANLEWVVTAYLLSLAVFIPASGWLGDRYGTKKVFIWALVLFVAGSILCGEARSLEQLIAFRVIQGIGGGMLTPVGTAMLFRAFPPKERAQASGVLAIPIAIAPALGPVLGGLLVDGPGWRWIFRINLFVGIPAIILAWKVLREHKEDDPGRFDLGGFLLSGAGLPLVLYGVSQGPTHGWADPEVWGTVAAGLALLIALVVYELRHPQPMLNFRLFGDRMFRNANLVSTISIAGLIGVIFLLPLFLQQLRGLSATQSGLTTFPQAIGMALMVRPAARLYPKIGPRRMLVISMTGTMLVTAAFLLVDLDTNLWLIRSIMFGRGLFFAFAIITFQAATFATISRADTGRASSLQSTNRQVGSSVGVALLATILAERMTARLGDLAPTSSEGIDAQVSAFHDAFLAGVFLSFLGVLAALLIHDEDAGAAYAGNAARADPTRGPAAGAATPIPAD